MLFKVLLEWSDALTLVENRPAVLDRASLRPGPAKVPIMELRNLMTFCKVATVLSFTRAAAELNYAQSSVTSQIRTLESQLELDLFDRLGNRIQLTSAGARLLPYAEAIVGLTKEAVVELGGLRNLAGSLTIGTTESLACYRLPPILELLHHKYPRLRLSIRTTSCADIYQQVRQGVFDVGFLVEPAGKSDDLATQLLTPEKVVLVSAPHHPLGNSRAPFALASLAESTILATEPGCSYRDLLEAALLNERAQTPQFLEFGTLFAAKRGSMSGLGVSLLPEVAVTEELSAGSLIDLGWRPAQRMMTKVAWRGGRRTQPEIRIFLDEIKASYAALSPHSGEV
jgi:DNA-binding transcriptional LysR family regulator